MRCELPDCKRCCLCVSLRHGIIIFGYLNLAFALFVLSLEIKVNFRPGQPQSNTMFLFRGVGMYAALWLMYLLYVLEVFFNVMLLIGVHRKDVRYIKCYYYYGIVTTLAMFLTFIVVRRYNQFGGWYPFDPFELALAFSGSVLQCYLLFLVRSELKKMRYQTGQFRYVNHLSEVVVEPLPPGSGGNIL